VSRARLAGFALALALAVTPAYSTSFTITATFDSSITNDPNAAAIEAIINSAIVTYETLFKDPINVAIDFKEMSSGLGQSSSNDTGINYAAFYSAYAANAAANVNSAASTALADGVLPNQTGNPLAGLSGINAGGEVVLSNANAKALGLCFGCIGSGFDGTVSLNTRITAPGSAGSSLQYELMPVVEHEIDEVLGLGSAFGQGFQNIATTPEDFFRYDASGQRSYSMSANSVAYFSVNGTTDLVQFNNGTNGGDWGDWAASSVARVQDAFASPGSNPSLGVEITALEALGYDLANPLPVDPTPEPGTIGLFGIGLAGLGALRWRRRR
jgi:hypothetical protein